MSTLLEKSPEQKAAAKDKSFNEFLAKPETKLILSLACRASAASRRSSDAERTRHLQGGSDVR